MCMHCDKDKVILWLCVFNVDTDVMTVWENLCTFDVGRDAAKSGTQLSSWPNIVFVVVELVLHLLASMGNRKENN